MAFIQGFLVDSSSLIHTESESAGCQTGTLEEFFSELKNKMAATPVFKKAIFANIFTSKAHTRAISVSITMFSGSRNPIKMNLKF